MDGTLVCFYRIGKGEPDSMGRACVRCARRRGGRCRRRVAEMDALRAARGRTQVGRRLGACSPRIATVPNRAIHTCASAQER